MVSIPRYLSEDEATVVLAALEPFHDKTLSYTHGSFGDFSKLPADVRSIINRSLTDNVYAVKEFRVYSEPVDNNGIRYYVLGFGANDKEVIALDPGLTPPAPHIIELAKDSTEPWTFLDEIRSLGAKGVIGILFLYLISVYYYYFKYDSPWAFVLLGAAILCTILVFVIDPLMESRRAVKVTKALLTLEERKTVPAKPSAESIIHSKGGSFGPDTQVGLKVSRSLNRERFFFLANRLIRANMPINILKKRQCFNDDRMLLRCNLMYHRQANLFLLQDICAGKHRKVPGGCLER